MNFTAREQAVLDLLCTGETPKGIAAELGISVHTVNTHVRHISDKVPGTGPPLQRVRRWILTRARAA